jgi:hypothetical protein
MKLEWEAEEKAKAAGIRIFKPTESQVSRFTRVIPRAEI